MVRMNKDDKTLVPVDPLTQLCMMLAWHDDYTDEYKREWLEKAIQFATGFMQFTNK